MILKEADVVHLADVIPGKDQNLSWIIPFDQKKILPDGVCRASVPVKPRALLRRNGLEEVSDPPFENIPTCLEVFVEGLGFVLRQDNDLVHLGVDAIAQREVNEPVNASKGDGRLRTIPGERHQPLAPSTRHDEGQRVFHLKPLLMPPVNPANLSCLVFKGGHAVHV
jgi:hypothetical protein